MSLPAPSWSALYDFPGNVASAWGVILTTDKTTLIGSDTLASTDAFLFGPRANVAEKKDCITYSASTFTLASDQQVRSTLNSNFFFAHYAGTLHTSVITPRGSTDDSALNSAATEHGLRVGRILALLNSASAKFTSGASGNLPYYEVVLITAQAIPRAEPEDDIDCDRTDIIANMEIWIRPDAFPAALP